VLENAATAGVGTYEFGAGNDSWKYDWNPSVRQVYDLLLFGSGLSGRTLHLAKSKSVRGLIRR
jgi:CelD/BcsL family acetyltransferase involved in cellulose biosynthesis